MHNYKKLTVWQKSVDLAVEMYTLTKKFPPEEKFGLVSQIRKCVISISSNIAEGAGRNTNGEFIQFIGISEGSVNELETQIIISERLGFITATELIKTEDSIIEIRKMLFSLKKSLKK
jgi:four helix bundle protein